MNGVIAAVVRLPRHKDRRARTTSPPMNTAGTALVLRDGQ